MKKVSRSRKIQRIYSSDEGSDENIEIEDESNETRYRRGTSYTKQEIDSIKAAYQVAFVRRSNNGRIETDWAKFEDMLMLKQLVPNNRRPMSAIRDKIYRLGLHLHDVPQFLEPTGKITWVAAEDKLVIAVMHQMRAGDENFTWFDYMKVLLGQNKQFPHNLQAVKLRYNRKLWIEDETYWTEEMTETLFEHFDELGVQWIRYSRIKSVFGYRPHFYRMKVQSFIMAKLTSAEPYAMWNCLMAACNRNGNVTETQWALWRVLAKDGRVEHVGELFIPLINVDFQMMPKLARKPANYCEDALLNVQTMIS